MKQITLSVTDDKVTFFEELVRHLDFVKITDQKDEELTSEEVAFVEGLKNAFQEVKDHQDGKIKLRSAKDFLNEL